MLGDFIIKIAEHFVLLFDQGVNKKVNKLFNIWRQFQNSTPFPNDMLHTQAHTFLSLTFWLKVGTMYVHYISNLLLFSIFQVNRAFNFNKTPTSSRLKEGKIRNRLVAKLVAKTWHCSRVLMAFLKVRIFWEGHKNLKKISQFLWRYYLSKEFISYRRLFFHL